MITIYYLYWKKDGLKGHWEKAEKIFYSIAPAIRFCWSMKNRKMILDGWSCYDPEDNHQMQQKVNIAKINGWTI